MIDRFMQETRAFQEATRILTQKNQACILSGLMESPSVHFVHCFSKAQSRPCIYVAPNELAAQKAYQDFCFFNGGEEGILHLLPAEYMLYDVEARSSENSHARMGTLYRLLTGKWRILVTAPTALSQWLPDPKRIEQSALVLENGQIIEIGELVDHFTKIGYDRVPQIDGSGQFSVRGDIVDVYPPTAKMPYRIEFFDNEIDSIRQFDVITQRTVFDMGQAVILPDRETYIWDEDQAAQVRVALKQELTLLPKGSGRARRMEQDIERIKKMCKFAGYDRYIPYILCNQYTIFDYIGQGVVFVQKGDACGETLQMGLEEHLRICETIEESAGLPAKTPTLLMPPETVFGLVEKKAYAVAAVEEFDTDCKMLPQCQKRVEFSCRSTDPNGGNTDLLLTSVEEWVENNYTVLFLAESEGKKKRFEQLLQDRGVSTEQITFQTGGLQGGFVYPETKFALISDGALFKRERARVRRKLKGKAITSFADIQAGDLVVHEVHGIGRFEAIESVEIDNVRKDYIKILYRDNGVLFVPTHQLDSVQKYIGNDGDVPKLNKLGSAEWNRTTAKVKESLRTYAKELVELYARRARLKGHAFSKDTVWQQEFEDAFPYEETDDQLRCSEEIKGDMEAPKPMERLLCGDVGYGKTEVALRAAFKAVCDGKQVAFMVPTTVLAQQHYKNFVERFKHFPITIDYLCRFRTATQRKKVLERLAEGKIDILVGTHSLIKDKVTFKNLGLAIIDEEQRFGVLHKDRFKQQHPEVDMLSLSATPIPRTLHMSLSGIRDISVLEDPPQDRLPVQTYVAEWDPALIRNGIYREMARKGQVFYLYNRVQTMGEKLLALRNLVPEARIAMAHGQMGERELEDIMQAFYQGEYDVLLCTTIIESGLDMPNVNTIIVEDSDRMGLAQLYQIRGRVGRASKLAYAYITYKKDKNLSEIAEKRLRTIREFTEFGSGFKIALRDLEIRGAGSVLGERQHGQLAVVGYETYCKLLSEVVLEEQGGKMAPQKPPISIEFKVNAYISSDYIEDEEARFDLYQKIARVETEEDALEVTDELIDRYGDVPETVQNLLKISRIRFLAERCGFSAVIQKPQCFSFILGAGAVFMRKLDGERELAYQHFTKKYGRKMSLNAMSNPASMSLFIDLNQSPSKILDEMMAFLQDLCGVMG